MLAQTVVSSEGLAGKGSPNLTRGCGQDLVSQDPVKLKSDCFRSHWLEANVPSLSGFSTAYQLASSE